MIAVGGRVKASSVGLGELFLGKSVSEGDGNIKRLRERPHPSLLTAFFPSDKPRLKQLLGGVGLFRPMLKTDQGMGGNFLPFYLDGSIEKSNLSKEFLAEEEGIAIPEPHHDLGPENTRQIQKLFHEFKLDEVYRVVKSLDGNRRQAEKGRESFFFIRPARTVKKIVFGKDVMDKVASKTNELLQKISMEAEKIEREFCGFAKKSNLLYCQPDVFISKEGEVLIEKINCPDVGFFLGQLENPYSSILGEVQEIVARMRVPFLRRLDDVFKGSGELSIVSRDEVLFHDEDVLEQKEIRSLVQGLEAIGRKTKVYPLEKIGEIPQGNNVILMNINYQNPGSRKLLERHCRGELNFFPNPFFQMACGRTSGLSEVEIAPKHMSGFLQLAGSQPKNGQALEQTWERLDSILANNGISCDILHVDIGNEVVPVFRKSMYSWRQLVRRIGRYENPARVKIRSLPVTAENLLIGSSTGPRLHTYRFLFMSDN